MTRSHPFRLTKIIIYSVLANLCTLVATTADPLVYFSVKQPAIYHVREEYVATITAYTASIDETDSTPTITADGSLINETTIACPSRYNFGTLIEFNGKLYECHDRMAARYRNTNRFDIVMPTKKEAFAWGKRKVSIRVVDLQSAE